MNAQHFKAFLWLRWRLRINQLRRAGTVNAVILGILAVFVVFAAAGLFVGSFALGLFVLGDVQPAILMYVWDGLVVALIFSWSIGLLVDLQQSEVLSLDKFLHLPVSLSGAFLINYLSSLFSVTLILFLPALVGLSLGLVLSRGLMMVLLLPLLVAFLFMVTAVTHQFRSWLASLMVNKRRRRTVIVVVTMGFVLITQVPNIFLQRWAGAQRDNSADVLNEAKKEATERNELEHAHRQKQITLEDYQKQAAELERKKAARLEEQKRHEQEGLEYFARVVRVVNMVLPPGWLPLGAMDAAEGGFLVPLLGVLGMALIGSASLWRSYRTTLRLYTGQYTSGQKQSAASSTAAARTRVPAVVVKAGPATLLEKKFPWISEQASAIAAASFRSLLRAPEVKMMFLTPIIMVAIFGAMFARQSMNIPIFVRPMLAFGAMSMILLSMIQLVGNQFGFDRSGFRVFVLCAASRRDVLLGKNLAFAPLALGLGVMMLVALEIFQPLRWDHLLAALPQMVSMYLLFCLLANCLSILAPVAIAAGSMKMTNIRGLPMMLHLFFVFLFPLVLAPTLLPLGIEWLLEWQGWVNGIPINLLLSLLGCAVIVLLYHLLLPLEGGLLQAREQSILQTVTKTE